MPFGTVGSWTAEMAASQWRVATPEIVQTGTSGTGTSRYKALERDCLASGAERTCQSQPIATQVSRFTGPRIVYCPGLFTYISQGAYKASAELQGVGLATLASACATISSSSFRTVAGTGSGTWVFRISRAFCCALWPSVV